MTRKSATDALCSLDVLLNSQDQDKALLQTFSLLQQSSSSFMQPELSVPNEREFLMHTLDTLYLQTITSEKAISRKLFSSSPYDFGHSSLTAFVSLQLDSLFSKEEKTLSSAFFEQSMESVYHKLDTIHIEKLIQLLVLFTLEDRIYQQYVLEINSSISQLVAASFNSVGPNIRNLFACLILIFL
jgi:hypothetical protein